MYNSQITTSEHQILKVLAYCFAPIASRDITKLLAQQMMATETVRGCSMLRTKGFLLMKGDGSMVIRPDMALYVLVDALNDEDFGMLIPEISKYEKGYPHTSYRFLRDLVAEHYRNPAVAMDERMLGDVRCRTMEYFEYIEAVAGNRDFDWLFLLLGEAPLYEMFNRRMLDVRADLLSAEGIFCFEQKIKDIPGLIINGDARTMLLAGASMLNGDFEQMTAQLAMLPEQYRSRVLPAGICMLYGGDALQAYRQLHPMLTPKKKTAMFVNYEIFYIVYYMLSLLATDADECAPEVQRMLDVKSTSSNYSIIIALAMMYHALDRRDEARAAVLRAEYFSDSVSRMDLIFMYVAACFTGTALGTKHQVTGEALLEKATANGYKLLALELAFALSKIYVSASFEDCYRQLAEELKLQSVLSGRKHPESWELALNNLLGVMYMVTPDIKTKTAAKESRVVYQIDPAKRQVHPVLQTLSAVGNWSKGRNIALKRLKEQDIDGMSEQDHRIASTLKSYDEYDWSDEVAFSDEVWPALAGHPYLFMASNPGISIELIAEQPTVTVEETEKGLVLKTDIDPGNANFLILKETATRYKLINIDAKQRVILQAIHSGSMVIPFEGRDRLAQVLDSLSGFFTIHSDLVEVRQGTRSIDSDPRIHVQLLPLGNSLKAELFVKPFGTVPPYCKPGVGGQNLIGMVNNERCHVSRDLKTETRHADAILHEIQQNAGIDTSQEPIVFDDPRDCLFLLDILSRHRDIALVEWPEGARFKVNRSVSMSHLNIEVRGVDYWFEMDGQLQVDEHTVVTLKKLLELNARSHGRFIELGDGEFLALSTDLKKRLDELQSYTDTPAGECARINRLASIPLMDMFSKAGSFKGDHKWAEFRKQLEDIEEIHPPTPPTLQAELRPYQEDGFRWMVRLAEWGAGACLADDMGLGKTVQALAVLLHRAEKGAALVVCPASVVPNWVNETQRFAPTLNVMLLTADNRRETLEKATAFDLIITTYGLLQSENKLFAREQWATVILDEAHAIKNWQTKTSKAAMRLSADFRLAMTGTPVQNHLGELWNLFHFINPGLLGTIHQFNNRFLKTEEQGAKRLRKLVAPFILRRTKNSVLEELPPKTEIVIQVELSSEERIFYEAIRQQAVDSLQNTPASNAGQQHVKVLAAITRLRLASCHPALVEPAMEIPSSKLTTFMDIVDELRSNNHRALVFSQFVKHLSIVRTALDKRAIRYKYLDGSTTLPERERNVREFQSGSGELFLISLKAGGLGINLTAADYVIHLDPWWNPAIEDQASDRAHRIGQKRPVTIYRLVSQHTIEDKIIQLHHTKRDIADHLLEGADAAGKLSTDELLQLIMEP